MLMEGLQLGSAMEVGLAGHRQLQSPK
jgi:hypothetical protein